MELVSADSNIMVLLMDIGMRLAKGVTNRRAWIGWLIMALEEEADQAQSACRVARKS